ncbi:MAG: hypothetical protein Q8K60_04965 [Parachlamydiaceae bacterium]|nr:hypothetical protein [Parachlamydiaceae bacterium]
MPKKCKEHLKDALKKNPPCYVLITCSENSANGQMNVEMTYQGDVNLVSYLLHGAQGMIEEEYEEMEMNALP